MITLQKINTQLLDAISLLEQTYMAGAGQLDEPFHEVPSWSFTHLPTAGRFRDQARTVWKTAVRRQIPVTWLIQTHTAQETLANFLCHQAGVPPEAFAGGDLSADDFDRLTRACGLIGGAPLRLCDIQTPDDFNEALVKLTQEKQAVCVICDWPFAEEELELANRLVENSSLLFVAAA